MKHKGTCKNCLQVGFVSKDGYCSDNCFFDKIEFDKKKEYGRTGKFSDWAYDE